MIGTPLVPIEAPKKPAAKPVTIAAAVRCLAPVSALLVVVVPVMELLLMSSSAGSASLTKENLSPALAVPKENRSKDRTCQSALSLRLQHRCLGLRLRLPRGSS